MQERVAANAPSLMSEFGMRRGEIKIPIEDTQQFQKIVKGQALRSLVETYGHVFTPRFTDAANTADQHSADFSFRGGTINVQYIPADMSFMATLIFDSADSVRSFLNDPGNARYFAGQARPEETEYMLPLAPDEMVDMLNRLAHMGHPPRQSAAISPG